jgi:hypothetical protein
LSGKRSGAKERNQWREKLREREREVVRKK